MHVVGLTLAAFHSVPFCVQYIGFDHKKWATYWAYEKEIMRFKPFAYITTLLYPFLLHVHKFSYINSYLCPLAEKVHNLRLHKNLAPPTETNPAAFWAHLVCILSE